MPEKLAYLTTYLIKLKTKFQEEWRCDEQANTKDILVFGREDGTMCIYVILTADCILIMY